MMMRERIRTVTGLRLSWLPLILFLQKLLSPLYVFYLMANDGNTIRNVAVLLLAVFFPPEECLMMAFPSPPHPPPL